jgi:simple sugar transport system permease protein
MPSMAAWVFGRTERALAAAILITVVVLSLSSPYFLTVPNLVNLVEAYSVPAILAAGVLVVLVCGGIDISFTATAAAAQYLAATLATKHGLPLVPTLLLSACLGIGLGALNALLIHYLRVGSIIVTIATSSIYYGLLIYLTDAHEIYDLPDWWAEPVVLFRAALPSGDVVKVGLPILVMCVVVLLTHILMNHTRLAGKSTPSGAIRRRRAASGSTFSASSYSLMPISDCLLRLAASCKLIECIRRCRRRWRDWN